VTSTVELAGQRRYFSIKTVSAKQISEKLVSTFLPDNTQRTDMPEPLVSILINNYNYGRYLGTAIESALHQTYLHTEVIIVDDGSTDNSRDVISSFGNRVRSVLKANGGQASAFNAGFAASRGDIICFLDSDDWFLPEKSAEVVASFAHGEYGWFFHLLSLNGNGGGRTDPGFRAGDWDYRAEMAAGGGCPEVPTATSALCFRRDLLERILPMPEQIRITSDNYLKWAALGLERGLFSSSKLAVQRIHGSNLYTGNPEAAPLRAEIWLTTAFHLHKRYPALAPFCARLGVAAGDLGVRLIFDPKYRNVVNDFLRSFPIGKQAEVIGRVGFRCMRAELRRLAKVPLSEGLKG
jgi:glycosyltransferase involved in cell wall biosynthesis